MVGLDHDVIVQAANSQDGLCGHLGLSFGVSIGRR
jgi:hypothetical protein